MAQEEFNVRILSYEIYVYLYVCIFIDVCVCVCVCACVCVSCVPMGGGGSKMTSYFQTPPTLKKPFVHQKNMRVAVLLKIINDHHYHSLYNC